MSKNKGFTLIELLVVIAIIGILASIVLASLTTARTKGQSAAVQAQLANMRAQAELFYSTAGNNYGTIVASGTCPTAATLFATGTNSLNTLLTGVTGIVTAAKTACVTAGTGTASAWAVAADDPANTGAKTFCVDSTGQSVNHSFTTAALSVSAAAVCN